MFFILCYKCAEQTSTSLTLIRPLFISISRVYYRCAEQTSTSSTLISALVYFQLPCIVDVPSRPPEKPELVPLNAYEMEVSWEKSELENNSPIVEYKIIVR